MPETKRFVVTFAGALREVVSVAVTINAPDAFTAVERARFHFGLDYTTHRMTNCEEVNE